MKVVPLTVLLILTIPDVGHLAAASTVILVAPSAIAPIRVVVISSPVAGKLAVPFSLKVIPPGII
jgi:hypothetical protein